MPAPPNKLPQIERVKLSSMEPMPGNREFGSGMDKKSIGELTESILAQGIVLPLILRPHPRKKNQFEIVAGVRRHAAALQAKLADAPCIVKDLTDSQALELRIVENLQRANLHEMEEARGYQELLDLKDAETGSPVHTITSISDRIKKSEAYIYARLKLLRMPGCAQEAFLSGKLNASVALLLCRIPDPKVAYKATLEVLDRYGKGSGPEREKNALDPEQEPMSFRQAKSHVQDKYMKRLKGAKFDQEDETLVPAVYEPSTLDPRPSTPPVGRDSVEPSKTKGTVEDFKTRDASRKAPPTHGERLYGGKCSDCPFRTGNMKKLAPDVCAAVEGSTDVCTNTACFQLKEKATIKREQAKYKDKGQQLLTEGQARKVLNYQGTELASDQYIDLRAKAPGKGNKTWEDVLEPHLPETATPVVARGKKTFLLLPVETAFEAAKKAGIKMEKPAPQANAQESWQREQEKREKRHEFSKLVGAAAQKPLLEAVLQAKPEELLRFYLVDLGHGRGHGLLDWEGKNPPNEKDVTAALAKMTLAQLCQHLVANNLPRVADYQGAIDEMFTDACQHFGVDLKAIIETVGKAQQEAETAAQSTEPPKDAKTEKAEAKK